MFSKFFAVKNENRILVMLAFFSIGVGLWANFRQLWLEDNYLSVSQISRLLGFGTMICAFFALVAAKYISPARIKMFISTLLLVKVGVMMALWCGNKQLDLQWLSFLITADIICEQLITISIYPLLVTIRKDDILYSKRKLVEYLFRDVGVLIGGLFVGRLLFDVYFGYNVFLFMSCIFLFVSFWFLRGVSSTNATHKRVRLKGFTKEIFKDKLAMLYFLYYFTGNTAYNTALGLKMLMFTNLFGFTAGAATTYFLVIGLLADGLGILCLKYFMPKNDYVTITIKFGLRFILYFIAFVSNSIPIILIAISWAILISTAYENKTDALYINRIDVKNQLVFINYRYIIGILGTANGLFLAGITYTMGVRYMLGLSAFLMVFQMSMAYLMIYMRTHAKESFIQKKQETLIEQEIELITENKQIG